MFSRKGFTLVELIVVIAIIGILATVVYAGFGGVREEARNRALQAEMKEVQLALEVYRAQEGRYPPVNTAAGSCHSVGSNPHTAENSAGTCSNYEVIGNLVPDFIADLPKRSDSANSNCEIEYKVASDGSEYKLLAKRCFAGANGVAADGIQPSDEFARCPETCGSCNGTTGTTDDDYYESFAIYRGNNAECGY